MDATLTALSAQIAQLEGWHVDDPLSPFVGEEVIARAEVLEVLAAAPSAPADVRDVLYAAVKHTLDQIQENPDVHYYCGYSTQIFYLLVRAEAAHLGKPLDEVETERRKDRQPSYRRREPEVLRLREERDDLRAQLDGDPPRQRARR